MLIFQFDGIACKNYLHWKSTVNHVHSLEYSSLQKYLFIHHLHEKTYIIQREILGENWFAIYLNKSIIKP